MINKYELSAASIIEKAPVFPLGVRVRVAPISTKPASEISAELITLAKTLITKSNEKGVIVRTIDF